MRHFYCGTSATADINSGSEGVDYGRFGEGPPGWKGSHVVLIVRGLTDFALVIEFG